LHFQFFVEIFCCFCSECSSFYWPFVKRNSSKWDRISSFNSNPSPLDYFRKQERDP
jgi:hypothetical protein